MESDNDSDQVIIQFYDQNGSHTGDPLTVPKCITIDNLQQLIGTILKDDKQYSFLIEGKLPIVNSIGETILKSKEKISPEKTLNITYFPKEIYLIRPVTRCTSALEGHKDSILALEFSPCGSYIATGGGDNMVILWDTSTETPIQKYNVHKGWVLSISWAPDSSRFASAGMDCDIYIWKDGKQFDRPLTGHTRPITSLVWQPIHLLPEDGNTFSMLASGSMDTTIRIWNVISSSCLRIMSGHTQGITQIIWSGESNYIYSASRDTLIKVWNCDNGQVVRELKGHGHWVNTLVSNTERALKYGPYGSLEYAKQGLKFDNLSKAISHSKLVYKQLLSRVGSELILSGSDDNTLFIWTPQNSSKQTSRMTGHQQLINHVTFSSDGKFIASASFDKSLRLWCGHTGKFIKTLRGHTGRVYRIAWSPDDNLFVSASADSTLKLWDVNTGKLKFDLPGHLDEVYMVGWSSDGRIVASGMSHPIYILL